MTLGEYRVGIDFNPGGNPEVKAAKRASADLIDLCETHRRPSGAPGTTDGEINRLVAMAQTKIEEAAMDIVKAITKPPRD